MVDPISAFGMATAAFNAIKKGFEVGRDVESMYGDIGRWMGAVSDVDNAEKQAKNPPLFGKLFKAGSIEEAALAAYAAKKKLENSEAKYNEAPTPALEATIELQKAEVKRLEALLKAQKDPNTDLDAKISKMKERLASLKTALAATPDDAALKDEIATLEDSLQKESENASFQPKVVCSRVCMDHEKSEGEGEDAGPSDSCMRMCVSVMRHVVYHLAEE